MTHRRAENQRIDRSDHITDEVQHHRATDIGNATGKNGMIGHKVSVHGDAIVIVWSKTGAQSR